jgi:anti-sigma factor RsiW
MNCKQVEPLLSEYLDNTLSARDTWEVDRHLTVCPECQKTLNELRQTVSLLVQTPRFELSEDFTMKLQARLEKLEPRPSRSCWLNTLKEIFRPRVLPAWGAATVACGLLIVFILIQKPVMQEPGQPALPSSEITEVQQAKTQNIALSASNPLDDLSAANLAAHSSMDGQQDSGK